MKITVFLLIGYISCTLKCAVIKKNTGNKKEGVEKGDTSDNPIEPLRDFNQTEDIVTADAAESQRYSNQTEDETRNSTETPRDLNKTKDVLKRDAREPPRGIFKTENVVKAGTVELRRVSNEKENVTTHAAQPPNNLNQTDDLVTIDVVESANDTRKQQEHVATTVIPEMVSKAYVMASKALIQQLDWSNSTPTVHPHYEDPPADTNQSESTDVPDVIESYVIASRALIHKLEWLNSTLPVSTVQSKYEDTTEMLEMISRNYIKTTKAQETHELDGLSSSLSDHTDQQEYEDTTEMLEKISRNYMKTTRAQDIHELEGSSSPLSDYTEQQEYEDTTEMLETISRNYIKTTKSQEILKLNEFNSNKIKTTMQLESKVDKDPGIIKVEDALKILELSKSKYALASVALIQRLEWLRSTYHVTELMLDHKVDVNQFINAQNSTNAARILRTNVDDEFANLKNAILNISSKLGQMIVTDK